MTLGLMPNIENKEKKGVGEGGREEKEKGGMRREGRRGENKGGEEKEGKGRKEEKTKDLGRSRDFFLPRPLPQVTFVSFSVF